MAASAARLLVLGTLLIAADPARAASPVPPDGRLSEAGAWYLAADRISDGTFNIRIEVSGVTLDLNGKTVRCAPDSPATEVTYGVHAASVEDTTIRNGKITGCFMGVHAANSSNTTIENVDFTGNTYIGVSMGGSGNRVRDSMFSNIAGYESEAYAIGINDPGSDCIIERNVFRNLHRQPDAAPELAGEGVAILHGANTSGCIDRWNWIENDDASMDIGIWIASGATAVIRENTITGFGRAIVAAGENADLRVTDNRLWLSSPLPGSIAIHSDAGLAAGNLIVNFETPVSSTIERAGNAVYMHAGSAEAVPR